MRVQRLVLPPRGSLYRFTYPPLNHPDSRKNGVIRGPGESGGLSYAALEGAYFQR